MIGVWVNVRVKPAERSRFLEAIEEDAIKSEWRAAADTLDDPTEPTRVKSVFPADRAYWTKKT